VIFCLAFYSIDGLMNMIVNLMS